MNPPNVPATVRRNRPASISVFAVCAIVIGMLAAVPAAARSSANDVTLVVARADSLSDVGVAVSLVAAGQGNAVLFAEEWDRLGYDAFGILASQMPASVLFVGGHHALSTELEDDIRRWLPETEVERLAGRDRIETAALAAERILPDIASPTVMVANGWSLPDVGTAASAVATGEANVVLYSSTSSLGTPTQRIIEDNRVDSIVIVGGSKALSDEVAGEARHYGHPASVRRIGGATRIETAALSAARAFEGGARAAVIADGWSLPDVGVAASLAASLDDAVVLYTSADDLAAATAELIAEHRPAHVFMVDTVTGTQHSLLAQLHASVPDARAIRINDFRQAARYALGTVPRAAAAQPQLAVRQHPTTLSVGWSHTCGLRTDYTVRCWGATSHGEADSPDGTFAAVELGPGVSCGLRTDSTITCWGFNARGQLDVPVGLFVAVSVGGPYACAIRTDDTVTCWGRSIYGQLVAPDGRFTAVSNGNLMACGIRIDQAVDCWASRPRFKLDPPEGSFVSVSAGGGYACGVRPRGTIECWGANYDGRPDVIEGAYSAVAAGRESTCAIRAEGTVICWSNDEIAEAEVPEGRFTDIGVGLGFACGLKVDGAVKCWGNNSHGQAGAPVGTFAARSGT